MRMSIPNVIALVFAGAIGLLGLSAVFGSFYRVDLSQRAVLLTNGAYSDTIGPGLHFKIPFIQTAELISTQTQTFEYKKVNSYSADQQPADVDLSLTLEVDPSQVEGVYAKFGNVENLVARIVSPAINQEFKVVFGRYTAASAIQDRGKLNADAFKAIAAALAGYPEIHLKGVQIENIDFSSQYISSIEARMQAEIEVQKITQNAQREKVQAEITVIHAKAEADARLAAANAEAQATKLEGEAQAVSIRAQSEAVAANPGYAAFVAARRWDGKLPSTMVPNATVPFLDLGK